MHWGSLSFMEAYGKKKATINQVANLAGVSVTTVSLYLRGQKEVCSKATARRIDEAVGALNYFPNPLAGATYNRVRHTIGLLAGNDLERGNRPNDVYNMRLIQGIFEVANELGYSVLTYPYRVFIERQYRALLDGRVDAVLLYGSSWHGIVEDLLGAGMPVVCFGSPEVDNRVPGWVHLNEHAVSRMALQHLWDLGHRRIAHLAGPFEDCYRFEHGPDDRTMRTLEREEPVSKSRRDGAIQFLEERSAFDPALFSCAHPWKFPDVRPTMQAWSEMSSPPTAIYCANDYIAWAAIQWARAHDLSVPDQIAVVGVDNVEGPDRELFLTSVDIDVEEIGRRAMHAILDVLSGEPSTETRHIVEPVALIPRGSTQGMPIITKKLTALELGSRYSS